jgi:hypothetical protein
MAANDLMLLIYRSEEQNRTARRGSGDIPEHWRTRAFGECRAAQNGRYVQLIVEREGALGAFASVPERHMRGTIDPRRGGWVR